MHPAIKYLGYAIIAYVFLWIIYMIFAYISLYYDIIGNIKKLFTKSSNN